MARQTDKWRDEYYTVDVRTIIKPESTWYTYHDKYISFILCCDFWFCDDHQYNYFYRNVKGLVSQIELSTYNARTDTRTHNYKYKTIATELMPVSYILLIKSETKISNFTLVIL